MWPIIIAEGLVAARRALLVADVTSTLLGHDEEEQLEGLRHASLDDDDIYYYFLTKGLFKHLESVTGGPTPTNQDVFQLVDAALCSSLYRSAAPDVNNSVAAFCTAFANELLMYPTNYVDRIKRTVEHMQKSAAIPELVQSAADDKAFLSELKTHLRTMEYKAEDVDLVAKAFADGAYITPKLTKYIADLGSGSLAMAESWISLIYSILSAGLDNSSEIYGTIRKGGLVLNSYLIPFWRPNKQSETGKRPTYMERSLSRGDVDRAERLQMMDKGYQMDDKTRTWVPKATTPTPVAPAGGKAAADVATTLLLSRLSGGLSRMRNAKRLASTQKLLKGADQLKLDK